MRDKRSNMVLVVPIGLGKPDGWEISWIDIVERHRYFHPIAGPWPKAPPNYIAFRYYGKLQSIHYVEDYQVVDDLHEVFPEIPSHEHPPHYVYTLGPSIGPHKEVRTGKRVYPSAHHWCMLDTLLTADTVREAWEQTQVRLGEG